MPRVLQFGAFPEYVEATDTVDQADVYQISVMPGDVIVAGASWSKMGLAKQGAMQECKTRRTFVNCWGRHSSRSVVVKQGGLIK